MTTNTDDDLVKRLLELGQRDFDLGRGQGVCKEAARALEALQVENGRLKAERIDAYEKARLCDEVDVSITGADLHGARAALTQVKPSSDGEKK